VGEREKRDYAGGRRNTGEGFRGEGTRKGGGKLPTVRGGERRGIRGRGKT